VIAREREDEEACEARTDPALESPTRRLPSHLHPRDGRAVGREELGPTGLSRCQ
jgi:hypothetical protein